MQKMTEPEVLEKWSHLAMKIFPPQTHITPTSIGSERMIQVRWKAEDNPEALSERARGVDVHFSPELVTEYLSADAEIQLKHDAFIESALGERLKNFNPYADASTPIEKWLIAPATPTSAA